MPQRHPLRAGSEAAVIQGRGGDTRPGATMLAAVHVVFPDVLLGGVDDHNGLAILKSVPATWLESLVLVARHALPAVDALVARVFILRTPLQHALKALKHPKAASSLPAGLRASGSRPLDHPAGRGRASPCKSSACVNAGFSLASHFRSLATHLFSLISLYNYILCRMLIRLQYSIYSNYNM